MVSIQYLVYLFKQHVSQKQNTISNDINVAEMVNIKYPLYLFQPPCPSNRTTLKPYQDSLGGKY